MSTAKKNQHYVPQFYLRNFSYDGNKKEIGVFNIPNSIYVKRSPIKTQASKDFFYGKDGSIENKLSIREGKYAVAVQNVIEKKDFPKFPHQDFADLIEFVLISKLRNPIFIEGIKEAQEFINEGYKNLPSRLNQERHKEVIESLFSHASISGATCADLDFKILTNSTNIPFFVSDNPIICYNQFLESRNWKFGKTAIGCTGLQIFIPLNPKLCLFLFDSYIYNVGNRLNQLTVRSSADIDQINMLQFLNCTSNVFFNNHIKKEYLIRMSKKIQYYSRPHLPINQSFPEYENNVKTGEFRLAGQSDLEIKLHLSFINYTANSKFHRVPDGALVDLRPHAKKIRKMAKEGKFNQI